MERGFSLLSNVLTDRRLRISHKAMENCLLIAANDCNFGEDDKCKIIKNAVDVYLSTKRKTKKTNPGMKRKHHLLDDSSDEEVDYFSIDEAGNTVNIHSEENDSDSSDDIFEAIDSENSDPDDESNN